MSSESGKKLVILFAAIVFAVVLIASHDAVTMQQAGWHDKLWADEIHDAGAGTIAVTAPMDFQNGVTANEVCLDDGCRSSWAGSFGLDKDGDGYYTSLSSVKINDDYRPLSDLSGPGDCADTDFDANPGQTEFFTRTVMYENSEVGDGDPSVDYDFDCDGVERKEFPSVTHAVASYDSWCTLANQATNPGECVGNPVFGAGPVFEGSVPVCGNSKRAHQTGKIVAPFTGPSAFCQFTNEGSPQCSYQGGTPVESYTTQGCN